MKVLITGCLGLLGQRVMTFSPPENDMLCTDLADSTDIIPPQIYKKCDLLDRDALKQLVIDFEPDQVINCAAYTNVDGAEDEREVCWNGNVMTVENLIYAARKVNARILHISTDYIFDGKDGPYTENAVANPLGFYGRSKLAAENALRASPLEYTIVRTMVLYGKSRNNRPDFVGWLINQLQHDRPVNIVTDQIGNTTLNDDLALSIWEVIKQDFCGIINIAGREIVSRHAFAQTIADVFDLDASLINPITTDELNQKAPRPLKSGLVVDKALYELCLNLSDVRQGLQKYKYRQ